MPRWPAGPTPTMVTGTPSIRMVRPTIDGSAPNFARPRLVADDGDDRRARRVLRRVEPAPERRPEPEHGQIGRASCVRRPPAAAAPSSR